MPNLIILGVIFVLGCIILYGSAEKDAQKTAEQIAKTPHPEPTMVQGEPSGGAWLLVIVILIVGLAVAFH